MKYAVALILFIGSLTLAQQMATPGEKLNSRALQQEGQLVSIRLEPGKPLKIFVVGREEANFNLADMKLTVRRMNPYPGETLSVDRKNNYFVLSKSADGLTPTELEVTAQIKDKTETMRFQIPKKN